MHTGMRSARSCPEKPPRNLENVTETTPSVGPQGYVEFTFQQPEGPLGEGPERADGRASFGSNRAPDRAGECVVHNINIEKIEEAAELLECDPLRLLLALCPSALDKRLVGHPERVRKSLGYPERKSAFVA